MIYVFCYFSTSLMSQSWTVEKEMESCTTIVPCVAKALKWLLFSEPRYDHTGSGIRL